MTRKILLPAVALAALATLTGCGSSGIFDRNRPDEFAVTRNPPLQVPQDYSLPAPQGGSESGLQADTKQQVLDAMFGTEKPGN